ncbi:MAG: NHL repeat-containing protein [bacterium]
MYQNRKFLLWQIVTFFVFVFSGISFAQETTQSEELKLPAAEAGEDVKSEGAKAAYSAMELVRDIGPLKTPYKTAIAPDGTLYIADGGVKILIYAENGTFLDQVGDKPVVEGEESINFTWLLSVATDDKGNIYAADYKQPGLFVISPKGSLLFTIPMNTAVQKNLPGAGPNAVTVNSRGDIYVCDQENGAISVYNLNGKYKYAIQSFKTKTGEKLNLARPSDMAVNSKDEVYVTDGIIYRVHRFNAKGNFLGSFGGQGDAAGLFVKMTSIAIDSKDRVYILDGARSIIQVFSPTGEFLYALSDTNGGPLQVPMAARISIDKKTDYLYVSQALGNEKVSIFRYVVAGAAKTLAPKK